MTYIDQSVFEAALSAAIRHMPRALLAIPEHRASKYAAAGFTAVTPAQDADAMRRETLRQRAFAGIKIYRSAA